MSNQKRIYCKGATLERALEIAESVAYIDNLSALFEQLIWRYGAHFEATWNNPLADTLPAANAPAGYQIPAQNKLEINLPQADNLDEPIEL